MSAKRQVAIIWDINKCMGCATCTVACKVLWTNYTGAVSLSLSYSPTVAPVRTSAPLPTPVAATSEAAAAPTFGVHYNDRRRLNGGVTVSLFKVGGGAA